MSFSGTVDSDFLKLIRVEEPKRKTLIDFTGSDFDSLRVNLFNYIKAVYPLEYNNFIESDFGGMLVDLMAYVGSVTSMKADFLANENYLRTAKNRNNVKKLLELVGVRLKGPISAATNARLTFDPSPFTLADQDLVIQSSNRTIVITSPQDGRPLNYTLYKVENGLVNPANSEGNIVLKEVEASNFADGDEVGTGSVFDNLVLLEGAFVKKTGTFGAATGSKTITLEVGPIVEGSVQVFVNGTSETSGVYTKTDNIYFASGASAKVFQVVTDDDFKGTIVFGDSILGISPNPTDTYVVTYRVGGGTRGNIANEVINTQINATINAESFTAVLENTSIGTGGAEAESVEAAKKYAGLTFRRQDRLVTLYDYLSFANSFVSQYGSTGRATAATRRAFCSANIIDIYVLEKASETQLRKATPAFKKQLIDAIQPKKMLTDEIVVVDGLIRTLDLIVTLRVDRNVKEQEEVIKAQARDTILSYMSIGNREFGREFNPQDLAREIYQNPYIIFATVDNYPEVVKIDFNEIIQLNNLTVNLVRI